MSEPSRASTLQPTTPPGAPSASVSSRATEDGLELRYRSLCESMQEGLLLAEVLRDADGRLRDFRLLEVNGAFERMIGRSREQLVGHHFSDFSVGTNGDWLEVANRVVTTGDSARLGGYAQVLERHVEVTIFRLTEERFGALFTDVSERQRAEDARRENEEQLRAAFDNTSIGMSVTDPFTGQLLRVNRRFCEMLGYDEAECLNRRFSEFTHPDDRERNFHDFLRLVRGEISEYRAEKRYVCKHGGVIWAAITSNIVRARDGQPLRTISFIEDITERKRNEQALRESSRRKDEFLAILSHELRNPLGALRNGLFVLERVPAGSDEAKRMLAILDRQIGHLSHLVDDLLDVARVTHGKVRLEREPVELVDLVRRTIEDHRAVFEANGVDLIAKIDAPPIWLDGDPTRLAQIVANLLGNAVKFTPRGGWAELALAHDDDFARLCVRDSGIGIDADLLPHLFDPFTQASQTHEQSSGGLGLGLTLVKGLVELHGGTVKVSSEGPGRGAEFTVRLPLEGGVEKPTSLADPVPMRRRRVLVIEDNIDVADTLADALEVLGHEVHVAHDGPTGISAAREARPEIVLCDIGLPGMSGYGVAEALRADPILRDTYLVALTGYARAEDKRRASEAGFDTHAAKPLNLDALERLMHSNPPSTQR